MRGTTLWWLDASKSAEATAEEEEARHRETDDHDPTRPFAFSENAEAGHRVWTNGLPETLRGAIYMTAVGANRPEIQVAPIISHSSPVYPCQSRPPSSLIRRFTNGTGGKFK